MKTFSQIRSGAIEAAQRTGESILSLFYPAHCAACTADTAAGEHLCTACAKTAIRIRAPFCEMCSEPFDGAITSAFTCGNCLGRRFHFESAISAYRARGVVRDFVHRFKYQDHFHLRHVLGDWMAEGLEDPRIKDQPFDAIIPVPLHAARKRDREFNQAEVLAKMMAIRSGKPLCSDLRRTRFTVTQTRLVREERMENLRGAFSVRHAAGVHGLHLLLIDDIFTTGSTVEECSRVLRAAGAASIRVLTIARA